MIKIKKEHQKRAKSDI